MIARAKRYYLPGHAWHITQRCHNREFLLKFKCDRKNWIDWLWRAQRKYWFSVLNYMITSNHIHLLVLDNGKESAIKHSMHLISGLVAQDYNRRKGRRGAFWEDRYHATAVETDQHLLKCIMYIDLNMVRAGVVRHPKEWKHCGYQEILGYRQRKTVINVNLLTQIISMSPDNFVEIYNGWIDAALNSKEIERESRWTESLAVGSQGFVENFKESIGVKSKGREIIHSEFGFELRESGLPYQRKMGPKIAI